MTKNNFVLYMKKLNFGLGKVQSESKISAKCLSPDFRFGKTTY